MWEYVIILAIALVIIKQLEKKTPKKSGTRAPERKESGYKITEYRGHYQARQLLTNNEWHAWQELKRLAARYNYVVCPKVRLLDIVEPRSGDPHYMAYMGKVQSKHVDFVICDKNMHIKGIVELDDSSHDRADRQERDRFVDEILQDVGYTIIHTRYVNENTLDPITDSDKVEGYIRIDRKEPTFEEWRAEKENQRN